MGTNYYHRKNICEYCDRFDEKHIGKSSAGWKFNFQGYKDESDSLILSFADLKKELQTGKIFNEYDKVISFDDFVKMVENKQTGKFNNKPNKNHYDYCQKEASNRGYDMSNDWKDKEGYFFSFSEFS